MVARDANRVPVSLRIPKEIAQRVEQYAHDNSMRKTDAYIHVLTAGLDSQQSKNVQNALAALDSKIDYVITSLQSTFPDDNTNNGAPQQQELEDIKPIIKNISRKFPAIEHAYVFGSFARGTQTKSSDIDIRLDLDRSERFNLHDLAHYIKSIEQSTGRKCDVITARELKNESFAKSIQQEGVIVYERKTR